ncbi:hypothetical protein Anas_14707 [Armadillidium nasatum]|uniref:Uncharacterized protein n=1 Tax=Armadillidium nasatum TaxID=96803 RepID=A0A5N5TCT0_9CRUS|nr:hypothetical protein Anas_14707 [Armadillidium nasatum]
MSKAIRNSVEESRKLAKKMHIVTSKQLRKRYTKGYMERHSWMSRCQYGRPTLPIQETNSLPIQQAN